MIGPDLSVYVGIGLLPVFTAPFILKVISNYRARAHSAVLPAAA